jgi:phosphoglycerol transferase
MILFPIFYLGPDILTFQSVLRSQGDLTNYYILSDSIRNGAFPVNHQFGFPTGLNWGYFPTANWLNLIPIAFIDQLLGVGHGLPWVYLISFPLAFISAFACGKALSISFETNILVALSATLLPWHFYRIFHFDYVVIYPMFLCVLLGMRQLWNHGSNSKKRYKLDYLLLFIICLSGPYYVVFALIILISAITLNQIYELNILRILNGLNMVLFGVLSFLLLQLPFTLGQYAQVPLNRVVARSTEDTLLYGGRLDVLLSPNPGGHLPFLSHIMSVLPKIIQTNEANFQSNYGTIFTLLTALVFFGSFVFKIVRSRDIKVDSSHRLISFGLLFLICLTFFVVGGPNHLIALYLTPQIRAWNRMTPILLLMILLGGAKVIDEFLERYSKKFIFHFSLKTIGVFLISIIVVLDQSPSFGSGSYMIKDANKIDATIKNYDTNIEKLIPQKCGILQLPIMSYPENGPLYGLDTYQHFDVAMADSNKYWTFGAIKNTPDANFQSKYVGQKANTILKLAIADGLCGIHIDLRGYPKTADTKNFVDSFGNPSVVGNSGNWLFFAVPIMGGQKND